MFGARGIADLPEGLFQITAQQRAIRLQRRRHLQVFASGFSLPAADATKATPQPGIAQRTIQGDGLIEKFDRRVNSVLRAEQEPVQRDRLGVSRRKLQPFIQRLQRIGSATEGKLQFGDPLPAKAVRR